jgi:hypothetical protein
MRFDIDVLIVFADNDNETTAKNEPGWVSQFKKFLELMLTQILGERPNVMLKAEYDNITSPKLENVAALVTILSRDFIQSGKCLDHVEAFYKATETGPAIPRIFKVFKSPLGVLDQPPRLRELLGYDMYQIDPDSGEMKEYTDYFSTDAERQYWMKMVDLTYDIYDALLVIRGTTKQAETVNYKRKTIYLAETGHDLSVQRNIIKRELQRHGYHVLPNQTLPGTHSELERIVKRDLEKSNLSIHLIGSAYGEIPEGSEKSIVDTQNKLAAERTVQARSSKQEFTRLIWIPTNIMQASERQKSFIESIKRDVEAQEGAEILQTSLEDFKNIMREELMEAVEKTSSSVVSSGKSVYVMHDRIDHTAVKPFIQLIKDAGFDVLIPEFEGELLELRQKHIENLRNLDAAIIYKGKVNEQWVRMKALDLLKAPGFGRKKPIIAKAIVTGPDSGVNAESFRTQNLRVIEGDQQKSLESLKIFLKEFNA